jgi:hypothetical protein
MMFWLIAIIRRPPSLDSVCLQRQRPYPFHQESPSTSVESVDLVTSTSSRLSHNTSSLLSPNVPCDHPASLGRTAIPSAEGLQCPYRHLSGERIEKQARRKAGEFAKLDTLWSQGWLICVGITTDTEGARLLARIPRMIADLG